MLLFLELEGAVGWQCRCCRCCGRRREFVHRHATNYCAPFFVDYCHHHHCPLIRRILRCCMCMCMRMWIEGVRLHYEMMLHHWVSILSKKYSDLLQHVHFRSRSFLSGHRHEKIQLLPSIRGELSPLTGFLGVLELRRCSIILHKSQLNPGSITLVVLEKGFAQQYLLLIPTKTGSEIWGLR